MKITFVALALAILAHLSPLPALATDSEGKLEDFIFIKFYVEALKNLDEEMTKKEEPILFESGAKATNCVEYLTEIKKSRLNGDWLNMRRTCSYSACGVLELLPEFRPHKGWRPESYAKELMNRLDFKSFRNSLRKSMKGDKVRTMADLKSKGVKIKDRYTLELDESDWYEKIMIDSDADVNGNGKPDWIISVIEQATKGTILTCRTYLILDVEPKGLLKVSDGLGMGPHWKP